MVDSMSETFITPHTKKYKTGNNNGLQVGNPWNMNYKSTILLVINRIKV